MNIDPGDFTSEALAKIAPRCAECEDGGTVRLVRAEVIYPGRPEFWQHADGSTRWSWRCDCGAYVGIHRGTLKPLGSPCGRETRRAREAAHAAFDPLWQKRQRLSGLSKSYARNKGYKWLAGELGIDRKVCHIGEMDATMALRVVAICRQVSA